MYKLLCFVTTMFFAKIRKFKLLTGIGVTIYRSVYN
jgi:hypothetical protein